VSAPELIYGMHAVRTLLRRSASRVRTLRISTARSDARVEEILELARAAGCAVERVDARTLQRALGQVAHQGVMAELEPLAPWNEERLLEAIAQRPGAAPPVLLLALDGVTDPHNLGACLRSADACGALAVIVPKDRSASLTATARKAAAGAAETTPLACVTNLARTLRLLKDAGLWIVGADAAGARLAYETDLSGPLVLVLGSEGGGLRQLTRQTCDLLVRLPQVGAVESLNVSVAAGVLLYETLRQRASGFKGPNQPSSG
jgi:23S rRNA (guanosine2251-2'-O)-methyltransferase